MILKELQLDKTDGKYLGLILLISAAITIFYINFTTNFGIFCSDVYVYLVNALYYTGENLNANSNMWLTPLTCFLTSLLFDVGLKDQISIFIVTGLLAIFGNIGLYLIFRFKFDKPLSFLGVIIYTTFSLNLVWLGNGSLDIPAVSLMIWTVLFGIIAVDKNPKYYLWTIVMFLLAFLIRYTVVLILPPLLLYFIYKKGYKAPWSELKYLVIPLVVMVAIIAIAIVLMYVVTGEVEMVKLGLRLLLNNQDSSRNPAYNLNIFYYAQNFFNFLSSSGVTFFNVTFFKRNPQLNNPTIIAAIYGLILVVGSILALKDHIHSKYSKKEMALTVVLAIITAASFVYLYSTATIALLLITLLVARKTFKSSKYDLSLMFLSWLFVNFVFFSHVDFKVNRYFIPCLPAVAYFIVYGIYKIQNYIKINKYIIPVILTVALLISSFTLVDGYEDTDAFLVPEQVSNYMISEHPDYKNCTVGAQQARPYIWYLEQPIVGVKTSNLDFLSQYNVTYYIVNEHFDYLENYTEIKNISGTYIYKHI